MARRPLDPSYIESMLCATQAILRAREAAQFTEEECQHRRANGSAALNVGIYYGGGGQEPGNLNSGKYAEVLEGLVADPDISRMASFADGIAPIASRPLSC